MFISKQEKVSILRRLVVLEEMVKNLNALQDAKTLAANPGQLKLAKKKKSVKGWTPEARAIHGELIKLMWAAKRAAKVAA